MRIDEDDTLEVRSLVTNLDLYGNVCSIDALYKTNKSKWGKIVAPLGYPSYRTLIKSGVKDYLNSYCSPLGSFFNPVKLELSDDPVLKHWLDKPTCSFCGNELVQSSVLATHKCNNSNCRGRYVGFIRHALDHLYDFSSMIIYQDSLEIHDALKNVNFSLRTYFDHISERRPSKAKIKNSKKLERIYGITDEDEWAEVRNNIKNTDPWYGMSEINIIKMILPTSVLYEDTFQTLLVDGIDRKKFSKAIVSNNIINITTMICSEDGILKGTLSDPNLSEIKRVLSEETLLLSSELKSSVNGFFRSSTKRSMFLQRVKENIQRSN